MKFDHSQRHLFAALALSLLAHLVAVFGWGWARPVPPAMPPVSARMLVVARPPVVATNEVAQPAQRGEFRSAPLRSLRAQSVVPPAPAVAEPSLAQDSIFPPTPAVVPQAPSAAEPVAAMPPARAVATADNAGGDGVSADGLRQYRIELAGAARRFRSYPAVARSRGWEGVAEVAVVVTAGLPAPSVRLAKPSGHAVLDEQAMGMLVRAVASTPLPDSLRGQSFVVPIPIRFSLEE